MKIILKLSKEEAERKIEDQYEDTRTAEQVIIRAIEDVCTMHQIRFISIETKYYE